MNIKVITPAYSYQDRFVSAHRYFIESCHKHDIPFSVYGIGAKQYPGWIEIKVDGLLRELKNIDRSNFSHILFTDSVDVFFMSGLEEIIEKYHHFGSPDILVSGCPIPQNTIDVDHLFPSENRFRYLHCGQYIATIDAAKEMLERFMTLAWKTGDDAHLWYEGWRDGWLKPTIDESGEIFQVFHTEKPHTWDGMEVVNGRWYNKITDTFPSSIHLSGGYHDPNIGKLPIMKEWYEKTETKGRII